ncbi:MAG TPA: threonine ammonia-lyase, partial [Polyangiaceae bacterium]|nr:threonine ammonia-lyase [Polyangiaceae bacterium]
ASMDHTVADTFARMAASSMLSESDSELVREIRLAQGRLTSQIRETPCTQSANLSELTQTQLFLKLENLQRTGSFKERGAGNRLALLSAAERAAGVVTASAGNHAQAVALHAQKLGVHATVVMPEATPLVKIQSTRRFGAEVSLFGRNYDEAEERARTMASERGLTYVHPFDDRFVIAGQGTLGFELIEQVPELDAVVVPVGGGGLIAGLALAIKSVRPGVRIYGVESEAFPFMSQTLRQTAPERIPIGKTIADGIAVRNIGKLTRDIVQRHVEDIVLVDEEEIAEAILLLLEQEKTVVEGAGAVGLAALVHRRLPVQGQAIAVILSGGNIDVSLMAKIIERGLVKTGRLVRFEVYAPDVAGSLARVTDVVAQSRANIVAIHHDRAFAPNRIGEALIELVLETFGFDHVQQIRGALEQAGYRAHIGQAPM